MQKTWQAGNFVDFGQASPSQHVGPVWGGVGPAGCAGVGFGAVRAEGFLPVEAAGGCKTVAGAYFRGRRAFSEQTLK